MDDNIISLRDARAKRMRPVGSYYLRIDLYDSGIGGEVEIPDLSPDQLRTVSEHVFALARHLRDSVWEQTQDADDRQLSVTRIYGSSRVACWTSNDITTDEQTKWLAERFIDAAVASAPDFERAHKEKK